MNTVSPSVLVGKAMQIAIDAHRGQFRRDGVTPYINHVFAVVDRVSVNRLGYEYVITAYLHDVFEDTTVTAQNLADQGISREIIVAVQLLTKTADTSYEDYLAGVKQNELARQVKIADMLSNLADTPTKNQIKKYAKGLLYLID